MKKVPRKLPKTAVKLEISAYLKEDDTLEISAAKPPILAGEIVKAGRERLLLTLRINSWSLFTAAWFPLSLRQA